MSVLPEKQGRGIGSKLIKTALSQLVERSAAGCVVLGEPLLYRRFGFQPVSSLLLPDTPPEYFQAIAFNGVYAHAIVHYHPAFNVAH